MRLLFFILAILFLTSAQSAPVAREFIIDTDMGIDDVIAISYFLKRHDIDIKALIVDCNGDSYCKSAYNNIKKLLAIFHRQDIPVACGTETSLAGGHDFPVDLRNYWQNFFDSPLSDAQIKPAGADATSLLLSTLRTAKKPLDILALGPLTTLAEVITQHPELKSRIRMIYYMGGAIYVPGNILDIAPGANNSLAEWNIYFDPKAASIVFNSGVPITLVPLDVTNKLPLDKEFLEQIRNKGAKSEAANFLYKMMVRNQKALFRKTWYFWDPLAAVIATDETMATFKQLPLVVRLSPESQSGALAIDNKQGNNLRVCLDIDKQKFKDTFLNTISN